MPYTPLIKPIRRIRVVLSATPLVSFTPVWKATALVLAELGGAVFFVMGVMVAALGLSAPWFVVAAVILTALVRSVDLESWTLLIPGGLVGRTEAAFGSRAAGVAGAAVMSERVLLAGLASVVIGHYAAEAAVTAVGGWPVTGFVRREDLATVFAVFVLGVLWIRARFGRDLSSGLIVKAVWISVGVLAVAVGWAIVTVVGPAASLLPLVSPVPLTGPSGSPIATALGLIAGVALALPVVGGGEALARVAHDLPSPRVHPLRRIAMAVVLFALLATGLLTVLYARLVPAGERAIWMDVPLAGLAQHLHGPDWARDLLGLSLAVAALLMLAPAAHVALEDAERLIRRMSSERVLPEGLAALHPRFGTATGAIDLTAAAAVMVLIASAGRVGWLARAYAMAIAAALLIRTAALIRLRRTRPQRRPFKTPLNVRAGGREMPLGLVGLFVLLALAAVATVAVRDIPSIATAGLIGGLALLFTAPSRRAEPSTPADSRDVFELLAATDVSLDQVDARPGNVLVPVRNPHSLAHVAGALEAAGHRDVVVMTARLIGVDVAEDDAADAAATPQEQRLFSRVVALAERFGRPVKLLIVPAHDVFDAVVATVLRLRSSEVYVGESSTLATDEQARLLGEAWERAPKDDPPDVRLVIYHGSGRTDAFHLGPHPPALTPGDVEMIHRVWLDAVKAVGPHVHHHDVVRAALTQMEHQLSGPNRDEALALIRQVARPADELAAVLRAGDYSRLRDIARNRHAGELATLLTELSIEDQVVVFRVLPRKDAAAVFEYLSQESKEQLLKAMAKEDIAALLDNMAPDDRTMFLEELPAAATRELLALLTPAERAVALTLLGYPDESVGRLMTPHYVAVREDWTVRRVLDHVREHGQDSETLNVIYVVDDRGMLIDDIRIREVLLTSPDKRVADLMDRRFVALKATDDQETAVDVFRRYDRTALPVTDTAGMLIGIVTIDDVLDVAEAAATRDIHRIGGSEALDEPYMEIAFSRMVRKRAGWLTALFLGEMLTATAMGAFEHEIAQAVVLALFVPLIISSGGNSGSQAATLVIRALALGEVTLRDWWRVTRREILAGLSLGAILGSIGFFRITLWSAFSDIYGPHWLLVAITVSLALVGIVLWGTLVGSLLPFLLRRLGFDPATSSAPFVATLVDVTGLVMYFSIAIVILRGTLL